MNVEYTTVDRILAKFHRDLKGIDVSESDVVEWIGEALEFLQVPGLQTQAVAFKEVNNFEVELPDGFHSVLQLARNNRWVKEEACSPNKIIEELIPAEKTIDYDESLYCCGHRPLVTDCRGMIISDGNVIDYRPEFDLQLNYQFWKESEYYRRQFTPIRLADSTFFNSIVCKERLDVHISCDDEYTIVGTTSKKIRVSFREGQIALSYLKTAVDEETGYPLIPDQISFITAITYYIKWKISEWYAWNGRQGYGPISDKAQERWEHYVKQAKNYARMPKTIDDFQDLLEQSHYLIPNHKKYYNYFGNLNKEQPNNYPR